MIAGMNWLDILYLLILLGMVYRGAYRGVGSQFMSVVLWVILVFCSIGFYPIVSEKLFGLITQSWAKPLAFFAVVAVMVLFIRFFGMIFSSAKPEQLSPIERIGGMLLSSLHAFLLFGVIGMQLMLIPLDNVQETVTKRSKTAMMFVELDDNIYTWIADKMGIMDIKPEKADS